MGARQLENETYCIRSTSSLTLFRLLYNTHGCSATGNDLPLPPSESRVQHASPHQRFRWLFFRRLHTLTWTGGLGKARNGYQQQQQRLWKVIFPVNNSGSRETRRPSFGEREKERAYLLSARAKLLRPTSKVRRRLTVRNVATGFLRWMLFFSSSAINRCKFKVIHGTATRSGYYSVHITSFTTTTGWWCIVVSIRTDISGSGAMNEERFH